MSAAEHDARTCDGCLMLAMVKRAEKAEALVEAGLALADEYTPCLDRHLGAATCDHPGCVLVDRLRAVLGGTE